jgi:hypothetical protein
VLEKEAKHPAAPQKVNDLAKITLKSKHIALFDDHRHHKQTSGFS